MEIKGSIIATLLLFLLLSGPGFSRGRLHVKNSGSEIYDIDYRGPETHTYLPPPTRAGNSRESIIKPAWPVTNPNEMEKENLRIDERVLCN